MHISLIPLLCMDRKIRIVVPTGCDLLIEERINGKWQKIQNHPEVVQVSSPSDAISAIVEGSWSNSRNWLISDTITIISFRNSFSRWRLDNLLFRKGKQRAKPFQPDVKARWSLMLWIRKAMNRHGVALLRVS